MSAHVPINNIIPFSLVDGPGARTSIFVQGCNLRCLYCHNPETQALCCACGDCVAGCPAGALQLAAGAVEWDKSACIACDACIHTCTHRSSPRIMHLTAAEVHKMVAGYAPFIRGITTSGGECMLYPEFLYELFERAQADGLSCLIDSNGTIAFEDYPDLLALCDGVMLDVKAWDDAYFVPFTGKSGEVVKQNLSYLASVAKLAEVRVIVTQGYNDPEAAILGIATTLRGVCNPLGETSLSHTRLRLMRFRPFGVVGTMNSAPMPSDARMDALVDNAKKLGFGEVVVS